MALEKKHTIVGESTKLQEVLRTVDLIACTDVPVLITGDTGTGKDLFAHRVHHQSRRKQYPFITVNCSSLDTEHAEPVLFGANKGKGALNSAKALIAQARSGTLFLDEIEELSLELQTKLLYFIENGKVLSVGVGSPQKYDVRIVVATKNDLFIAVEAGKFRADLYYRLNVIPLELPALNQRENDVSLLIEYFFKELVRERRLVSPSFSKVALRQVISYQWPGNIRELQNFCERMFILFSGKEIDVGNLPHEIRNFFKSVNQNGSSPFSLPSSGIKLESVEVDLMLQALDKTSGNKSQAARLLGLTRDTFLYRLKKYSITL